MTSSRVENRVRECDDAKGTIKPASAHSVCCVHHDDGVVVRLSAEITVPNRGRRECIATCLP